jgi:hypothetical protein
MVTSTVGPLAVKQIVMMTFTVFRLSTAQCVQHCAVRIYG